MILIGKNVTHKPYDCFYWIFVMRANGAFFHVVVILTCFILKVSSLVCAFEDVGAAAVPPLSTDSQKTNCLPIIPPKPKDLHTLKKEIDDFNEAALSVLHAEKQTMDQLDALSKQYQFKKILLLSQLQQTRIQIHSHAHTKNASAQTTELAKKFAHLLSALGVLETTYREKTARLAKEVVDASTQPLPKKDAKTLFALVQTYINLSHFLPHLFEIDNDPDIRVAKKEMYQFYVGDLGAERANILRSAPHLIEKICETFYSHP